MKANHNNVPDTYENFYVVVNLANWQNESKSQPVHKHESTNNVVVNLANWQNESKSQHTFNFFRRNIVVVNLANWQNESKSQQDRK